MRRGFWIIAVLLIMAMVVGACGGKATPTATAVPTKAPTKAPKPTATQAAEHQETAGGVPGKAKPPTGKFEGIPVGFTVEGDPYLGQPDAPVTIIEYSDYQCPFCGRHEAQTSQKIIDTFIKTGVARLVFRDMPLVSIHLHAMDAAVAADCAGEQGAEAFWKMNRLLFKNQKIWVKSKDVGAKMEEYAKSLGLDTSKFKACFDAKQPQGDIQRDVQAGSKMGIRGTPGFWINGRLIEGAYPFQKFQQVIEDAKKNPTPQPTATPTKAQADPFGADPDHPGFTYDGSPMLGTGKEPVFLLVVQDFGSEKDAEFENKILPVLQKEYVKTGKARIVFNYDPRGTPTESLAAACASQQGSDAFWKFYHKLLGSQNEWKALKGDAKPTMKKYAKELGLDTEKFDGCLDKSGAKNVLNKDLSRVMRWKVQETPYAFIVSSDYQAGKRLGSGLTLDQYKESIDALLERLKTGK